MSNNGNIEDQKEAVNIGITLSSQLITAALAMIAVIGAFSTYILDKREVGIFFYTTAIVSGISFVASIFFGGKGINKARKNGFNGNWDIAITKVDFNRQALCSIVGLLFFVTSLFLGKPNADEINEQLTLLRIKLAKKELLDSANTSSINILKNELNKIRTDIDSLEKKKLIKK
jgi:hypothetical protein